ncbi:DUF4176 domain-containing protein [Paenibacillus profundus]|uniref:DUF4176 domain-containing protein n=1 Tax=Paenibacillus profundus TaxID=1173085 RepID=A0ABS8YEL6_9BACL|nr:DUF4176 domain-containing protein [Paenibacillus profundus]MCE5170435.1 DUF4176 domain-containing protein [Paenibacillus profundus]
MEKHTEQHEQLHSEKTLLPLGSIVLLREGSKKLMIYGRKQLQINTNRLFDYLGVVYPEGYIDENFSFLFNHEDIDVVAHVGFSNYEEEEFQNILQDVSLPAEKVKQN